MSFARVDTRLLVWLVVAGLIAILPAQAQVSEPEYSFIVAGHLYGEPDTRSRGLYRPFMQKWQAEFAGTDVEFAVFTGDLVSHATQAQWQLVDRDIATLGIKVHIAPGNHDLIDRDMFESRYGATYFSFREGDDLFIILDSELNDGSISGLQLQFLRSALMESDYFEHIFVFMHSLVWIVGQERFGKIKPNRMPAKDAQNNFWTEVAPLLRATKRPTYVFGGDLGASRARDHFVLEQDGNITLAATGMGSGKDDNFIEVSVYPERVDIRKVSMLD